MMKLWSFIFCDPAAKLQSARVAAPDKATACLVLSTVLEIPLDPSQPRLGAEVLLQYAGDVDAADAGLLSAVLPDGREVAA